jgi:hypothetical protein
MDVPSFCMMLARSHLTLGRSQVALMLLMNCMQRSDHDRTESIGSLISQVLAEDNR